MRYYQEFIVQAILTATVGLGFLALVPTLVFAARVGRWQVATIDLIAFLAAVFLLFSRSLTYEIRVASIITLCYLLGLGIILKLGMLSGGPIWLFTFLVLTSLFLGLKAASCALVVNGATLSITGWLIYTARLGPDFLFFDSPLRASISGINFLILNAITAISIHIMIRGLKEMAQKEHIASARLGREKRQLMDAHAKLNKEIAIRRDTESRLQAAHDELDLRVKERTRQLAEKNALLNREIEDRKKAQKLAEKASQAKSEFLANMSHELRTPLNHILGFTELVADGRVGELTPIQTEYLQDVLHSSSHLLSLINDILDLSKVEAGKMDLELADVNPKEMLERSLIMLREKALKHGIAMKPALNGLPDAIHADGRKLRQILYNLLSNAVKFTPDGGQVTISAAMLARNAARWTDTEGRALSVSCPDPVAPAAQGRYLHLTVADTGIGICAENLERIFHPFEQADNSRARPYQGTGLGLPLTRRLVELHGGKIWAESDGAGKGSRFRFIIPA